MNTTAHEPTTLTGPREHILPAALLGLAAVALAASGALVGRTPGDPRHLVGVVLVVAWAVAGTCALRDRDMRRLGSVVLVGAVLGGIAIGASSLGEDRAGATARFVATMVGPLLIALSAHFLLALPRGELIGGARRRGVAAGYAAAVAVGLALWDGPGHMSMWVGACALTFSVIASLPGTHKRYLCATGVDRRRLQCLASGAVAAAEVALVAAVLHMSVRWPEEPGVIAAAGTVLVPLALAATTSSKLVGRADRLLVRIVSTTGLTLVAAAVYLIIVFGLGIRPDAADRRVLGLSMFAAAASAVSYVATRQRLNELAKRLVYGELEPPDEVLRTFETRLTSAVPMDELLLQIVESLRRTMSLTAAEVWTGTGDVFARAVSVPDRPPGIVALGERELPIVARASVAGNAWVSLWLPGLLDSGEGGQLRVAPITHAGGLLGLIVVERPALSDTFTDDDDRIITDVARQIGRALHNVQLDSALQTTLDEVRRQTEELRASRTRIVATADAERRKIERNLHDGAQQRLVALAVNLRLIKNILAEDPAIAAAMIDAMAVDVKETIQDLRDLAHGIYPPLLLDSGLVAALRAAADRSPLAVRVSAEGIERYEPDLEAAVYFCCLEALQNAAKHAPGSTVEVRLREESGGLLFDVGDDGPGLTSSAGSGHGFVNMSDRLGAIGGTIRWGPNGESGALVTGAVPLPNPAHKR